MTSSTLPDLSQQVFVLPTDVRLVALCELSPRMRTSLGCSGDGGDQVAVSRPGLRVTTRLITAHLAALLAEFREPSRLTDAVLRFSRTRSLDPLQTLDDSFDALALFVSDRLLVPADSPIADAIAPSLVPGQRVAAYEVECVVSALEDTEVYRVSATDGRSVALKLARPAASSATAECLTREARVLEHLQGGHSPLLVEHGTACNRSFVAMEWRSGVSIAAAAHQARAGLDRRRLQRLCANVLAAYAWLHERGVIHGDIHPGNIVVGAGDHITILDFGRAHRIPGAASPSSRGLASASAVPDALRAGVPYFYEPEIADALLRGATLPPATVRGEQYSLAALLYYLLTGVHYADLSPEYAVLLQQVVDRPPLSFTARGLQSWSAVEDVLCVALAKDPCARFADLAAFRDAFDAASRAESPASAHANSHAPAASSFLDDHLRVAKHGWDGVSRPSSHSDPARDLDLAWFAHRAADVRDDPELLAAADVWACRARACATVDWNIDAVAAAIDRARGDSVARARSIHAFVAKCAELSDGLDYLGGRSGALAAGARLLEAEAVGDARSQPLSEWVEREVEQLWRRLDAMPRIVECAELPHLGIAHGWAGVLVATLDACRAAALPPPSGVVDRLEQLAALAERNGRGSCWPGTLPHARSAARTPSRAPGWCSGSAGHVWLWTLAGEQFGDARMRELAELAAWHALDHPASNANFCCGTTGRAFALLRLYQSTGSAEWLAHARRLASTAVTHWMSVGESLCLRTGSLGAALLALELEAPERAVLPIFGGRGRAGNEATVIEPRARRQRSRCDTAASGAVRPQTA